MSYAELHCLSNFSFLRGASHASELVARAKMLGYAALAITDECSMAGIVRADDAARKAGLKLIVGTEVTLNDGLKLVLLAPDHAAYSDICGLISRGRKEAQKGEYSLERADMECFDAHALALWVPRFDGRDEADAQWLRQRFGVRGWIAAELHRDAGDEQRIDTLFALGRHHGLRIAASGDVHMHGRPRRMLQDTMTAVRLGRALADCGQGLFPNGERHLRRFADLQEIYPEPWLRETLEIAARCSFCMRELKYEYPHELVPDGLKPIEHLRALTAAGLRRRWPQGCEPKVRQQIEKELVLIAEFEYEHFFLTVEEIVRWARDQDILCQGRGSAANSAVCYALGITEVDPARSNLLFERFLSRERAEPPDIDVDFEHERREEVIQHVYDKYGRQRAAIAATVIRYQPRSAVRDVGKALGIDLNQIDTVSKLLAWWDDSAALAQRLREVGLDPNAPQMRQWIWLINELIEMPRHLSQHVGGFVISDAPLSQLVPVEKAAMPDRSIIQWDKDDLESLGLLKVDVLALGMLTALQRCFKLLDGFGEGPRGMQDVPAKDDATYAMIQRADTVGVFQIESRAQMSMLPRLRPREFYDIVVQVAIVRPGPIQGGMVHPYLQQRARREKGEEIEMHPRLVRALARTLGVPLFQEQVMQIAIDAADFTPGEADQVRRSMAAWKRDGGLEHFHDRLVGGMTRNGFDVEYAERIYQMVLGFGSYGFPESHAASFALLAWVSSWLKCHRPAAFFAALINSQPMGFYQPAQLIRAAQASLVKDRPVEVRGIDARYSDWDCTLERNAHGQAAIRLGLRLVQGLPQAAALRLMDARRQSAFEDVGDLAHRAQLNARERKALADADALSALGGHRHAARWQALGVENLPGMLAGRSAKEGAMALRAPREGEDIIADYASTGLTLRRHPVALLRARLDASKVRRAEELNRLDDGAGLRICGLVINRQRPPTASGVMFMTLEDETGSHNLVIWEAVLREYRRAILGASFLIVDGVLQKKDGVIHVVARQFEDASAMIGELRSVSRDFH